MPYAVNDGTRIYYEITGSGPVVLLMHGVGDTSEIWHRLGAVERLAANFTVVTIDLRGLGRSDRPTKPSGYLRDLRRDDTIAVLDAIGADRVHLVGYSLGARNAIYVAAHQPERVASVVLGAANPFSTPLNLELTEPVRAAMKRRPKYVRAIGRLRRIAMERVHGKTVADLIALAPSGSFDVDAAAAAMAMPVYMFIGEFDERFAVELTKDFAERLPDCRLEIVPGENHGMLARLQPMLPKIEAFLTEVAASTA